MQLKRSFIFRTIYLMNWNLQMFHYLKWSPLNSVHLRGMFARQSQNWSITSVIYWKPLKIILLLSSGEEILYTEWVRYIYNYVVIALPYKAIQGDLNLDCFIEVSVLWSCYVSPGQYFACNMYIIICYRSKLNSGKN